MLLQDESLTIETHDDDLFSIRQMANAYGVTLRALRFYEDRGLISPVRRGYARLYDPPTRSRLQLILKGKQLGFTLTEIREMLAGREEAPTPALELAMGPDKVAAQLDHLERQRDSIERAIAELRATHERLAVRHAPAPVVFEPIAANAR